MGAAARVTYARLASASLLACMQGNIKQKSGNFSNLPALSRDSHHFKTRYQDNKMLSVTSPRSRSLFNSILRHVLLGSASHDDDDVDDADDDNGGGGGDDDETDLWSPGGEPVANLLIHNSFLQPDAKGDRSA
eukprot:1159899-Pelagomonas_calceolata.AAC.2